MDVRKELLRQTGIVALGEALGVAAMMGIFALLGKFDMGVLWGGIVGGLVAIANFFVMAIGVNIAADKAQNQDVKGGQAAIKGSYALRMLVMAVVLFAFAKSGICNVIALVVPLVFVRFTLTLWEFFRRKPGDKSV
ncbi:MAG: ATP synthase subunit I [Oscillospiraceae bacterium]|nr:ATP synthase subunit I [Oscillospiraceae bacterium]MBQ7330158.1 ATP synthase subunit I [Oscillospiraceae bacterium]